MTIENDQGSFSLYAVDPPSAGKGLEDGQVILSSCLEM
jgi:hypothetical protein